MNKFKKYGYALALLLTATSCRKKEEPVVEEPKQVIEVEKQVKETQKEDYKITPMTFGSRVVVENIAEVEKDNFAFDIVNKDKNFTKIENGDFDIAVVPAYLGPYFYEKTNKGIEVAAITSVNNIYLVSDKKTESQMDYRGKNFYIPDPAGNLTKIIDKNIGPLNLILRLNVEYYKTMEDILKKMETTSNYITVLQDPYYTKALRKTHYVSKLEDLLPIKEGEFLSEIIIVNKDYLKDNKEKVDKFLEMYKSASNSIDDEIEISSELLKFYDITEDEAKLALERMDLTYIDGEEMKKSYDTFMDRLGEVEKSILGKEKPSDDFYYTGK